LFTYKYYNTTAKQEIVKHVTHKTNSNSKNPKYHTKKKKIKLGKKKLKKKTTKGEDKKKILNILGAFSVND
jgi:hypothetical protein